MAVFPFFIGKAHCWEVGDKFASSAWGNSDLHIPFPAIKPKRQGFRLMFAMASQEILAHLLPTLTGPLSWKSASGFVSAGPARWCPQFLDVKALWGQSWGVQWEIQDIPGLWEAPYLGLLWITGAEFTVCVQTAASCSCSFAEDCSAMLTCSLPPAESLHSQCREFKIHCVRRRGSSMI